MGGSKAIGLALCIAGASPAAAQISSAPETGSHLLPRPTAVDERRSGSVVKSFAQCVYRKHQAAAARLLVASDPLDVDYRAAGVNEQTMPSAFDMGDCLADEAMMGERELGLRMSLARVRALLAEEAYLAQNPRTPTLPAGATEEVARRYVSAKPAEVLRAQALGAFADCVTFRNTPGSDALLRTDPGGRAERAAAVALAPTLGECLGKGQQLAFNPADIRVIVADGLWTRYARPASAIADVRR